MEVRNSADQAVYQCEKSIEELGDKLDAADKTELQQKLDALKEALKGQDTEAIKQKQEDLMKKFYDVSAKVYQANAPADGAPADGASTEGQPNAGGADGASGDGNYYNGEVK